MNRRLISESDRRDLGPRMEKYLGIPATAENLAALLESLGFSMSEFRAKLDELGRKRESA